MPTGISGLYKNTKGAKASPKTHHVKILPDYFKAVKNGTKTFEIRLNDRDYKVGDMICLEEYRDGAYTGKVISKEICYMIDGPAYCKEGYVVLGLKQCAPDTNVGGKSESEQTREMQVDLMLCIVKSDNGEVKCGDTAQRLYNAGWRKQSEWISVDERLPDNHKRVLIACEGTTIGGASLIAIGSYGGGLWSIADANGTAYLTKYMYVVVTHWMPLPEAPKMKGGGADA